MHWKLLAVFTLATVCLTGEIIAQAPSESPMFKQWIVQRSRFSMVGGRVVNSNGGWMFGMPRQLSADGSVQEQISFNGPGSLAYSYRRDATTADHRKEPSVEFAVEAGSEGRFVLKYSDKEHPQKNFDLNQTPGRSVRLSLPGAAGGKPRVLLAPSVWHLLIINDEDCRRGFLPLLESLRDDWHVGRIAQSAEDEMVKMAAVSRKPDRKQWETWVNQLADPLWTRREAADRNLRDVGPAVLGYLNRLNSSQLDAEQKARLLRIIRFLSTQTGEDTPEHVASMLIEDPLVWLALLGRPEESTRQTAVQQLTVLVNVPIHVDPKAEPASQAKARDELRGQIEKLVGESAKAEEDVKPLGGSPKTRAGQ